MRLAAALFCTALLAAPAFAQPAPAPAETGTTPLPAPGTRERAAPGAPAAPRPPRMTMQQRFEAANTSHDGKLTLDQARAGKMTRVAGQFEAIDAGKRGYVTLEDIRTFNKQQRAAAKPATP